MRKASGLRGGTAAQQLLGNWAETAGIERKTGMQVRSFALGRVPAWVLLPPWEQYPPKAVHRDKAVPGVHAVLAARSHLQQHAVPSQGRGICWKTCRNMQLCWFFQ